MTSTTELPALPAGPVDCTPWCEEGTGHPDAVFAADQTCFGPGRKTALSLHPVLEGHTMAPCGHWADEPDYANAYAMRNPGQAQAVAVQHGDGPEMRMTPEEAERFAQDVLAAVQEARS
jgi:hypothetical protein